MIKSLLSKYFYHILLLLSVILGYFVLSFFIHPLKWDYTSVAYPFHYFVGECLQNGELPLWNPYQLLGYPIHADPQSASWYPVIWFFSYFFGYNIYILNIEFLFHVFIAAIGFYALCKTFKLSSLVAFSAAIVYAFSGFIVCNSTHFYLIYSVAWLPWLLTYYLRLRTRPKLSNSIIFALFFYLNISGGYPGFSIMMIYLFILIIGVDLIINIVDDIKNKARLWKSKSIILIKYLSLSLAISILLLLPFLVSWFQIYPMISRAGGIEIVKVLKDPLTYQSLLSLLFPYSTIANSGFYDTCLLMTNMYIGIIPILLVVFAITKKKPREVVIIGLFGLFTLFFALGEHTPIREFCYNYLPFTSIMRMPGLYRFFTVFSLVLFFAFSLDWFLNNKSKKIDKISIIGLSVLVMSLIAFVFYLKETQDLYMLEFIKKGFLVKKDSFPISSFFSFQAMVLIVFLLMIIGLLIFKRKLPKAFPYIFIALISIEIISANIINQASNMYFEEYTIKEVAECNKSFPDDFPIIDNSVPISQYSASGNNCAALWRNLGAFKKHIAYDGYSSFILSSFEEFEQLENFNEILENPFVSYNDTNIENNIIINEFGPNSFAFTTNNNDEQEIVIMQNYCKYWQARTENSALTIDIKHKTLMSVKAPPNSKIYFEYKPKSVIISFYVSAITSLLSLLLLVYFYIKRGIKNKD